MSGVDELETKVAESARRRVLCDVLDTLGADGVAVWYSGDAPDALMREIFAHVRWLEARARQSALEDAAKRAEALAAQHAPDDGYGRQIASAIRAMQPKEET